MDWIAAVSQEAQSPVALDDLDRAFSGFFRGEGFPQYRKRSSGTAFSLRGRAVRVERLQRQMGDVCACTRSAGSQVPLQPAAGRRRGQAGECPRGCRRLARLSLLRDRRGRRASAQRPGRRSTEAWRTRWPSRPASCCGCRLRLKPWTRRRKEGPARTCAPQEGLRAPRQAEGPCSGPPRPRTTHADRLAASRLD